MNKLLERLPFRLVSISITIISVFSFLAAMTIVFTTPAPVYAEHNNLRLACPDPILEGNSDQMSVRRSGYTVQSAIIFTHHGDQYTAEADDFEEYHGVKFESGSGKKILRVPIVTEEDTVPEHDETFAIGFQNDGVWHQCVVTIEDDDAPEITGVDIISSPADNHAYRAGEGIDFTVNMDAEVEVEDTPLLSLFVGDEDDSDWRGAEYRSGSGSRNLLFRYRVRPEDFDSDGISVSAAAPGDDRGAAYGFAGIITAEGTDVPIDYTHPGVKGDWRQQIDGRPFVQSARIISSPPDRWDAYRANQIIEVSLDFNSDVVVEGEVSVDLHLGLEDYNWDAAERKATYLRGSGSDTLVFGYTIQPGDMDSEGVGIIMGAEFDWNQTGFDGSGSIKAKGTEIERNPWYLGTGHQPEHKVDTETPALASLIITSRPANGNAYDAGESVTVEAAFGEQVTTSGDPHLQLNVGGQVRQATLAELPEGRFSNSLLFRYEVQEGDTDSDGIAIDANVLRLNGGGIHDSAGNAADISHRALSASADQAVRTST